MRLVIDSNVWVSALVFGGTPRRVFRSVVADGHSLVASEELFTEVRRVLSLKFPDSIQDFDDLQTVLQSNTIKVALGSHQITASRDKDDNVIIETAVNGGASYIVSGDKDLLDLQKYEEITILNPTDFLRAR